MTTNGPSPHLSWTELACRDGSRYPPEWRTTRLPAVADLFEAIRAECDRPIVIGSAYRTPAWNRKKKGRPKSQHVQGRALDLHTPGDLTAAEFHALVRAVIRNRGRAGGGIGYYGWGVHVDTRPGTRLARWHGRNAPARDV